MVKGNQNKTNAEVAKSTQSTINQSTTTNNIDFFTTFFHFWYR